MDACLHKQAVLGVHTCAVCVALLPCDVVHSFDDGVAQGVSADLQNAAGDEEEEEEHPTHTQG